MKINIKKSDCFFKVDEKNRKVVCVYTADPELAINYIHSFNRERGIPTYIPANDGMYLPWHTVGIAKCAEGDTWDEELGRDIAFAKMKAKFGRNFFRAMEVYFKFYDKNFDDLEDSINSIGSAWRKGLCTRTDRINKRLQELNKE